MANWNDYINPFERRNESRSNDRRERDEYSSDQYRPTDSGRAYNINQRNTDNSEQNFSGRGPKGWKRSDERIRDDVSETLERHAGIDASEIEVDVKEGIVHLKGSVSDRRQKRMAEDAVEYLSGVKDVRNELMVNQSLFQKAKDAIMGESSRTSEVSSTSSKAKH